MKDKRIAFYSHEFRLCEWPEEPNFNAWGTSPSDYTHEKEIYDRAITSVMENGVRFDPQERVMCLIWERSEYITCPNIRDWQPKEGDNWPAPEGAEIIRWDKQNNKECKDKFCRKCKQIAVLRSESVEKKESADIFVSKISYDELSTHELLDNLMCSSYYQEPYFGGFEEWRETDIIQQDIKRIEARLNQSTTKERHAMEEIREAPRCINIVPALGGGFCCSEGNYCTCGGVFKKSGDTTLQAMTNQYHTALRRADMWRRRAEAAENKLQHITAPESSPAPLESQDIDLLEAHDLWSDGKDWKSKFILTRRTEVSPCDSCDHKSCGYPNSDCRDSWKLESDYKITE